MSKRVLVLNGPNLGRLGAREPAIYGDATYDDLVTTCTAAGERLDLAVEVRQTDDEARFVGWLHEAADGVADALVLNPAAWTHTSVAIRDAAAQLPVPFVEVHLSNPLAREEFRHVSYTAGLAAGVVAGFGTESYVLALQGLARRLSS
ncbi:MAG TPA: type II 3-dehydroquinate dehydratase [Mycobacteriales bacterium]|nr:type II 3-dehydroquinate dehydratase [Mycobacteriales bacterium]